MNVIHIYSMYSIYTHMYIVRVRVHVYMDCGYTEVY